MIKKICLIFLTLFTLLSWQVKPLFAQITTGGGGEISRDNQRGAKEPTSGITNPVIGNLGGNNPSGEGSVTEAQTGGTFLRIFISIWKAVIFLGSLLVIVMFLWGSVLWILAGGDKGKVEKARDRMTQAIIGLVVLVSSFVIIGFTGALLFGENFDILKLTIPTLGN